jgi:hypothetical protein
MDDWQVSVLFPVDGVAPLPQPITNTLAIATPICATRKYDIDGLPAPNLRRTRAE